MTYSSMEQATARPRIDRAANRGSNASSRLPVMKSSQPSDSPPIAKLRPGQSPISGPSSSPSSVNASSRDQPWTANHEFENPTVLASRHPKLHLKQVQSTARKNKKRTKPPPPLPPRSPSSPNWR